MAVNSRAGGHPLPCGREVEDLLDLVDTGRADPHVLACEHCQTAQRSLEQLAAAARELAADPTDPPPGLLDRIMSAVRAEIRSSDVIALPTRFGPADVSQAAVAAVLRYAADSVDGVWSRSCRTIPAPDTAGSVRIQMTLSLRYGSGPAENVLAEVRRRLATALAGQVGLVSTQVDLTVVDVWLEEGR